MGSATKTTFVGGLLFVTGAAGCVLAPIPFVVLFAPSAIVGAYVFRWGVPQPRFDLWPDTFGRRRQRKE